MKSGKFNEIPEKVETSVVIVGCCQELMVHWHSSSYHEFKGTKKKIIKFMFGYVSKATLKAKVFMSSNVLGCLKAGYCRFNMEFILTVVNHDKWRHMSEVVLVSEVVELGGVVDVGTVSGCCHSAPDNVSCMSICLNVSESHA